MRCVIRRGVIYFKVMIKEGEVRKLRKEGLFVMDVEIGGLSWRRNVGNVGRFSYLMTLRRNKFHLSR